MKRILLILSFIFILVLLGWKYTPIIIRKVAQSTDFQFFGAIYSRVETSQKVVALSFDDGPSSFTDEVLAILDVLDVKATFFVTGRDLQANMNQGMKIVAAGHELGNHSFSHQRMVFRDNAFVRREIEQTDSLIRAAGYQGEILFRPPYGWKLFRLPYYLSRHDRKTIMWDVAGDFDPQIADNSTKITNYVLENTRPGSIILLHVMFHHGQESRASIELIVDGLRHRGYDFLTVSELVN